MAGLERTGESLAFVTAWLESQLERFFEEDERVMPFGGAAILLRLFRDE